MRSIVTIAQDAGQKLTGFDVNAMFIASAAPNEVTFVDQDTGLGFSVHGRGLRVENGVVVKGSIDDFAMTKDGEPVVHGEKFHLDAAELTHASRSDFFLSLNTAIINGDNKVVGSAAGETLLSAKGSDIVNGHGGDDVLNGGPGADRLTGGSGWDTFVFEERFGHDTVTDFDAIGGQGHQDLIAGISFDLVEIKGSHGDTIIDFGSGDVLTLLDVNKRDVDQTDFAV